jgi:hypothetical protein
VIAGTLTTTRRRRLDKVLTGFATVILVTAVAVVWVRVVQTLTEPSDGPKTIGQPGALVWDDRVFTSPGQLKAYLNSQGLSYSRWRARHPTAFGAPAPAVTKHATTKKKTPTPKKTGTSTKTTSAPPRVAAPQPLSDGSSKPLLSLALTILLLIAGVILGGSALVPQRYAPVAVQQFYADPDRRMVALLAATAILFGFGVSFYLS